MIGRTAIIADGRAHSYDELDDASKCVAGTLLGDNDDLKQTRVAFLVAPGFATPPIQRGIWRAGGVAVPLAVSHPPAELEYVIRDADASVVVADASLRDAGKALARAARARFVLAEDALQSTPSDGLPHLALQSARADHLHQRHDWAAEGRGDHAPDDRRADFLTGQRVAMDAGRSPAARAAAASRARHHQRPWLRARHQGDLRDAVPVRCRRACGSASRRARSPSSPPCRRSTTASFRRGRVPRRTRSAPGRTARGGCG